MRYRANPKLGRWVCTQRQQYQLKKIQEEEGSVEEGKTKSMMNEDRQTILESLGFVWEVRQSRRARKSKDKPRLELDVNITDFNNTGIHSVDEKK